MNYSLKPFSTETRYHNQVKSELALANVNFTLLGQAFVNNDPTQPVLRPVVISPTSPLNPAAGMLWLDTTDKKLKVYDGSVWKGVVDDVANSQQITELKGKLDNLKTDVNILDNKTEAIKSDVKTVKDNLDTLKTNTEAIKSDVNTFKSDVNNFKSDFNNFKEVVKSEVNTLKTDTETVKKDVSNIKDANDKILSAFMDKDPTKPIVKAVYIGSTAPSNPTSSTLWYDISANILKLYDGVNWEHINDFSVINAQLQTLNNSIDTLNNTVKILSNNIDTFDSKIKTINSAFIDNDPTKPVIKSVYVGSSIPANPVAGMVWYDTTKDTLNLYNGLTWKTINDTANEQIATINEEIKNIKSAFMDNNPFKPVIKAVYVGSTTPANPVAGMLWHDTKNLKLYDGFAWRPVVDTADLEAQLNDLKDKLDTVKSSVDTLDTQVKTVNDKVDNVKSSVDTLNTKVDTLDDEVDNVKTDVSNLNQKIHDVESTIKVVDDDITALKQGVKKLNSAFLNDDPSQVVKKAVYIDTVEPTPITNMLWYDTTNDTLKVYDGETWKVINSNVNEQLKKDLEAIKSAFLDKDTSKPILKTVVIDDKEPAEPVANMLWFDNTNKQLKLYDGVNWETIGDLTEIKEQIKTLDNSVNTLNNSIKTLDDSVDTLNNSVSTVNNTVKNLNTQVEAIKSAFVDKDPTKPIIKSTYSGSTEPTNPDVGMTWFDTNNNTLKVYNGSEWKPATDTTALKDQITNLNSKVNTLNGNVSIINSNVNTLTNKVNNLNSAFIDNDPSKAVLRATHVGSTAPENPVAGTTWLDTSTTIPTPKVYDGNNWLYAKVSETSTANAIPIADNTGKISDDWLKFEANDQKVKTALNAVGEAPIYACRAWVNFNGNSSTPTIRASGNVSSVVRNGTGDYTINFTTPMPDTNYVSVFGGRNNADGQGLWLCEYGDQNSQGGKTTTSLRVRNVDGNHRASDIGVFMVAIFR